MEDKMPMNYDCCMIIRDELPSDTDAIRSVVTSAFTHAPHSNGTEAAIVEALRAGSALTISLIAEKQGEVVGHVAFSPVSVGGNFLGWFGLGPVAVVSDEQHSGIGRALIEAGLERLRVMGAQGCVVLGEPNYYSRFGFERDPNLRFPAAPTEYFQRLCFYDQVPSGVVEYHPAFY
ncbi:MAG: N-acetyltransferase [Hyphomicrobium sp.]